MKRRLAVISAAVMLMLTAASCTNANKGEESSSSSPTIKSINEDKSSSSSEYISLDDAVNAKFKNIADLEAGPELYLSETSAAPGEEAEVTLSVKGAEPDGWQMCGIHITYPDTLSPVMSDPEERIVATDLKDASKYTLGSMAMLWADDTPDYLAANNLHCVFFTEIFSSDDGLDGDIFSFKIKIPEDAESGTVYPLDYYYMVTDTFSKTDKSQSFEKYAFTHMHGGSITVK